MYLSSKVICAFATNTLALFGVIDTVIVIDLFFGIIPSDGENMYPKEFVILNKIDESLGLFNVNVLDVVTFTEIKLKSKLSQTLLD